MSTPQFRFSTTCITSRSLFYTDHIINLPTFPFLSVIDNCHHQRRVLYCWWAPTASAVVAVVVVSVVDATTSDSMFALCDAIGFLFSITAFSCGGRGGGGRQVPQGNRSYLVPRKCRAAVAATAEVSTFPRHTHTHIYTPYTVSPLLLLLRLANGNSRTEGEKLGMERMKGKTVSQSVVNY